MATNGNTSADIGAKNKGSLITFMLLLGVSLTAGIYMIMPYLQALIAGGILTLIMLPVFQFLRNKQFGPRTAATISMLSMLVVIVAPLLIMTVMAVKQAAIVSQWFAGMEHLSLEEYFVRISNWGPMPYLAIDPSDLESQLRDFMRLVGTIGTRFVLSLATTVPQVVLQLLLACFTCYCLLINGHEFLEWIFAKIPMDPEIRVRITAAFKDTSISVVVASMAAAAAQAVIMIIAFAVLGLPNIFLVGGATFFLAWIPIFGSSPIWLAGAIFLYSQESIAKAIIMLAFGGAVGVVDNLVRPFILKGRGEMHPLVSLVAIFGGLQWFGFFGVFLGPILAAVVISLLQLWPLVGRPFGLKFADDRSNCNSK